MAKKNGWARRSKCRFRNGSGLQTSNVAVETSKQEFLGGHGGGGWAMLKIVRRRKHPEEKTGSAAGGVCEEGVSAGSGYSPQR